MITWKPMVEEGISLPLSSCRCWLLSSRRPETGSFHSDVNIGFVEAWTDHVRETVRIIFIRTILTGNTRVQRKVEGSVRTSQMIQLPKILIVTGKNRKNLMGILASRRPINIHISLPQ